MQDLLASFIQYIKDRKSIDLEDLAVEFGLKVQARPPFTPGAFQAWLAADTLRATRLPLQPLQLALKKLLV